jgi:hypothetical protein
MALEDLQWIEQQIGKLDQEIASLLRDHQDTVKRLAEVPGLGVVRLQNQLEALLEEAHIKLSSLVSDLLGVSARRMLQALAEGETDPAALAAMAEHIDSRYAIRHASSPGGSGERAKRFIKQGLVLSPLPLGRDNAPLIRSITHAPDQTVLQPRLLRCVVNLAAPATVNSSWLLSWRTEPARYQY